MNKFSWWSRWALAMGVTFALFVSGCAHRYGYGAAYPAYGYRQGYYAPGYYAPGYYGGYYRGGPRFYGGFRGGGFHGGGFHGGGHHR